MKLLLVISILALASVASTLASSQRVPKARRGKLNRGKTGAFDILGEDYDSDAPPTELTEWQRQALEDEAYHRWLEEQYEDHEDYTDMNDYYEEHHGTQLNDAASTGSHRTDYTSLNEYSEDYSNTDSGDVAVWESEFDEVGGLTDLATSYAYSQASLRQLPHWVQRYLPHAIDHARLERQRVIQLMQAQRTDKRFAAFGRSFSGYDSLKRLKSTKRNFAPQNGQKYDSKVSSQVPVQVPSAFGSNGMVSRRKQHRDRHRQDMLKPEVVEKQKKTTEQAQQMRRERLQAKKKYQAATAVAHGSRASNVASRRTGKHAYGDMRGLLQEAAEMYADTELDEYFEDRG
ncbi:MAG: hypothetical protein MHM6MM_003818 [Cercozoa sp. M6MM]